MSRITVIRTIRAPLDEVFQTVADIHRFSPAVPEIVKVEMLSGNKPAAAPHERQ